MSTLALLIKEKALQSWPSKDNLARLVQWYKNPDLTPKTTWESDLVVTKVLSLAPDICSFPPQRRNPNQTANRPKTSGVLGKSKLPAATIASFEQSYMIHRTRKSKPAAKDHNFGHKSHFFLSEGMGFRNTWSCQKGSKRETPSTPDCR